ncbi:hypothetical protein [Halorubrum sp. Atlit-28R]|uniref:hypothetical protein n=1 Tax=Halorubrum sp. Atlit-28R TaxID=2282129 RepID=UPI000EF199A7|nr:hypothetical protein [Halorubrum sp. Atlit-28R]RLM50797.1 hypothetical protein DVK06_07765 [Halorubrum sp. Atlit-28R]
MPDEPLPATERTDAEPSPTERGEPPKRDATDRIARAEPDRTTDPPPDRSDGDAACECDRGPEAEADEAGEPDTREYRLERLRLWRTVVTLAVVVARLIRSL